ncbi:MULTISPECIES: hypothetical protein [Acinetobacter]|uniref:hypothetical protein n=1 Tax=Acinetobacter TaxID=469 RepID=UPI000E102822|nr:MULTISPECIES: hypothetical protein [Acinetobacter]AXJ89983.1 hypothetical protein DKP84_05895 [Acinetobacter pittii]MDS7927563.1 hypothetical protein [Acinetobacter sp. V115_6]MZY06141.1 hypothetical protein [Acinetobacter pittii]
MVNEKVERELFVAFLKTKGIMKIDWNCMGVITNMVREAGCALGYNDVELMQETWMAKAKLTTWQPIETAPKDRNILLQNSEGVFQGEWDPKDKNFNPLILEYHGCGCCGGDDPQPDRWMELPLVVESGAEL